MADTLELNNIFERNQHQMMPDILQRLVGRNVVIDIFEKGTWPGSMGDIIDTLTVERSFALSAAEDGSDWQAVNTNGSTVLANGQQTTAGAVLPPEQILTTGQTRKSMQLFTKALESDNINLDLIRGGFELANQLSITELQFTQGVEWELEKRFLYAYRTTSSNLVCATMEDAQNGIQVINNGTQGFPTSIYPDIQLEQGYLDMVWDIMENETHGDGAVGHSEDGANVYMLLCEPMTSRGLKVNNADIRQDLRYAHEGTRMESPLLQPYGMGGRCYGNFVHKTYKMMPRYDYDIVSGKWKQQPYWLYVANPLVTNPSLAIPDTGTGYSWVPNPAYKSAEFSSSYVINTKVFKWLTPGMLNSPGGGATFDAPNYFPKGMQWLNERNLDKNSNYYNPDKTIGHYRAVMAAAIQPQFPTYGWCILHKRYIPVVGTTYTGAYVS